jgi:prophage regulatory protein
VTNRVLRLPEVKTITGLSRSTIYLRVAAGSFPRPVSLGPRAVGWLQAEVEAWISSANSPQGGTSQQSSGAKLERKSSREMLKFEMRVLVERQIQPLESLRPFDDLTTSFWRGMSK